MNTTKKEAKWVTVMTQFNTIELLFNQLFKLTEEIKTAVVQEAYSEADNKLKSREALFKKIVNAAKTATLTDTEEQKISELDTKFKRMEKENTILFEKIRDEFKEKLTKSMNLSLILSLSQAHFQEV